MTPDVTVSIVNHRNRDRLLETLAALGPGSEAGRAVEVVVLDNASGDGSVEAVRDRFPHVRVLAERRRRGFGANHNLVLAATRGRYVLLLNDDAVIRPAALDRLCDELDRSPTLGAVAPRILNADGTPQASAWRFPSPAAAALGVLTLGRAGIVQSLGDRPRTVDWATAAVLLLRRAAVDLVGPFDEGFFMYAEETDLLRRLADAGYGVRYVPEVEALHHGQTSSGSVPTRRVSEHWRSRHRYWRKHHGPLAARTAAALTGLQYGLRAAIAAGLLRLPPARRPAAVDPELVSLFRLNARCALAVRGPGLAELAAEWNAEHPS